VHGLWGQDNDPFEVLLGYSWSPFRTRAMLRRTRRHDLLQHRGALYLQICRTDDTLFSETLSLCSLPWCTLFMSSCSRFGFVQNHGLICNCFSDSSACSTSLHAGRSVSFYISSVLRGSSHRVLEELWPVYLLM